MAFLQRISFAHDTWLGTISAGHFQITSTKIVEGGGRRGLIPITFFLPHHLWDIYLPYVSYLPAYLQATQNKEE